MAWSNILGDFVAGIGEKLGAGEWNLSETLGGTQRPAATYGPATWEGTPVKSNTPPSTPRQTGTGNQNGQVLSASTGDISSTFAAPSVPSDSEISSIYNPIFDSLNAQEAAAKELSQGAEKLVGDQSASAITNLTKSFGAKQEEYKLEEDAVNRNLASALAEAVRSYNALSQQGKSRFGGGSSAGQAVGELVQQQYFKNQGELQQTTMNEMSKLNSARRTAQLFYESEKQRIQDETNAKLLAIRQQLSDTLMQIGANRATTEAQKSQMRQDALNRVVDFSKNIQNQIASQKLALEAWKQQFDYAAGIQSKALSAQSSGADIGSIVLDEQPELTYSQSSQGPTAINYNPNVRKDDEFSNTDFFLS